MKLTMHDPKFEKEVQQKMTELEFSPSESVWANVEKEINQLHTRRSFPFFWRLALPALLLLAGGGYYFFRSKPATVSPAYPVAAASTHTNPAAPASSKGAASEAVTSKGAASETATGTTPSTAVSPVPETSSIPAPSATSAPISAPTPAPATAASSNSSKPGAGGSATLAAAPDNTITATRANRKKAGTTTTPIAGTSTTTAGTNTRTASAYTSTVGINTTATRTKRSTRTPTTTHTAHPAAGANTSEGNTDDLATTPGTGNATMEPATKGGMVASGAGRQPFLFNPALANLNASPSIHASKLTTKNTIAIKTLQSPHRPWEAAFAGGIGVSSLHQAQISNVTLNNAVSSFSSTTVSNSVTYAAARPSKQYVSTVKPGISFWAGVLANKPLSDRWSLSLGLNLYYYSTRVRIGEQVNTYTPSTATLLTSSAVAPIQSYPYYNTGTEQAYTNRYYFMELPVAAEWKINRSHLLPLFWDGGFSVSYLMGSSAVYYNTKSGVYFKDGGVANHTQVNISTALMVGLPVKGLRVQLGPQVQYGLTPLLNTELSGPQHIFYGGLRLVVYPGKK
jgi:hypothetical protein